MKKWSEKRIEEIRKGLDQTAKKYGYPVFEKKPKKDKKAE